MKEIYIVAGIESEPVTVDAVRGAFDTDEVEIIAGEKGTLFTVKASGVDIDVRFEKRGQSLGWSPDLITGSEGAREILQKSKGFYRISFPPMATQATVAVFEGLWCARAILETVQGDAVLLDVTSFKLHEPGDVVEMTELDFDIRDHVTLHAVSVTETQTPLWVHSHGMVKFAARDLEVFHLSEDDLEAAERFMHELCTDLAFGQGPGDREQIETSSGESFMLVPSEEARTSLFGVSPDAFEGHEGLFSTVVSADGRHHVSALLKPYREEFQEESQEEAAELERIATELLPAFKARFMRKGLMEPLSFLARAGFETHPKAETTIENLWFEIVSWDENQIVGRLIDGGKLTTEWRKGAHIELEDDQINAIGMARDGQPLEEAEMRQLLVAEKPS